MHKFNQMGKWQKYCLYLLLAVTFMLLFLWVTRDSSHTYEWEGEDGIVNIFPVDADSKNYRLKSYMTVHVSPSGLIGEKKSYDIDYVIWPNGGKMYFEECEVIPSVVANKCLDNDFREWIVEVYKEPKAAY